MRKILIGASVLLCFSVVADDGCPLGDAHAPIVECELSHYIVGKSGSVLIDSKSVSFVADT